MCLAVPMELVSIRPDGWGEVALDSVRYAVDLSLIEDYALGDYLIVHAGFAIERLDLQEAEARLALFERLASAYSEGLGVPVGLVAPPEER